MRKECSTGFTFDVNDGFDYSTSTYTATLNIKTPPSVSTAAASSVDAFSAVLGGNALTDGGAAITERGVVYSSTDATPRIGEGGVVKDTNGSGTGIFSETISLLTPGTTYYSQAYATNAAGTAYGGVESFTTSALAPAVVTNAASGVSTTGATLNGTVNANNASTIVTFEYGLTTVYGTTVTADQSPVTGTVNTAVSKTITGLIPNTTYHYRAAGQNTAGTVNGADMTFGTSQKLPAVTTQAVSAIMPATATGHGTLTDTGAPPATQHGICWNTGGNPALSDPHTGEGAALTAGPFTSNITGLSPHTLYYVRAYATNELGTVYGNEVSFTTTNTPPAITYFRDLYLKEDQTSDWLDFNINDAETDSGKLTVRGESNCQSIMLDHHIRFMGTGSDRFVRLRPNINQSGAVIIKIFVSDGIDETVAQFNVIISPVNDPPVITPPLPDLTIGEGGACQLDLDGFVSDADHALNELNWTANLLMNTAGDTVQNGALSISSSSLTVIIDDTSHVVRFQAGANSSGIQQVIFEVNDPEGAANSDTLTVTIYAVNGSSAFLKYFFQSAKKVSLN